MPGLSRSSEPGIYNHPSFSNKFLVCGFNPNLTCRSRHEDVFTDGSYCRQRFTEQIDCAFLDQD
jgi:hypothetical protein